MTVPSIGDSDFESRALFSVPLSSSKSHTEAANLVARAMAAILLGKGLRKLRPAIRNQIRLGGLTGPGISSHRASHGCTYDKNVDEEVHPSAVPDDVIQAQSDKYWAPHPKTGVFGPMHDTHLEAAADYTPTPTSVTEPKAWFRPLEDVEKPRSN